MRRTVPGGILGMVHLEALPGSPANNLDLDEIERLALADARTLEAGGVDAILVENFGDVPFAKTVDAATVAMMTRIVRSIVEAVNCPVGVNVLRNDPGAALAIAAAIGAAFIRVNVHVGAMLTDQGLIEGEAATTLRLREHLCPDVAILADVGVKHATPFEADWSLEQEAKDAWHRGLADALVLSGSGTGAPTDPSRIERVRAAVPEAPLIIGSGFTGGPLTTHGAIVGTALKREGRVDMGRVRELLGSL